ncbi:MAG TPA: hypothetical protein VIW70_17015 [Rubrivivax sp.]
MTTQSTAIPCWSTAAFAEPAHTSPGELRALGQHMQQCQGLRGRLFTLRCAGELVHRALGARIVTTLTVAAALIGTVVVLV